MSNKAFFGVGGTEAIYTRKASHGYKTIKVDAGLGMGNLISMETEGDDCLVLKPMDGKVDLSKDSVTFMCKSFGVSGDIPCEISVIFCDDGNMLVTLHEGMLHVMFENKVISPVAGNVGDYNSNTVVDGIYWIDADTLLSSKQYFGSELQGRYTQDFEYAFLISGGIKSGLTHWSCRCLKDKYIDLSLGFIAEAEDKIIRKKRQNDIDRMNALWSAPISGTSGMVFDTPDDEEEEYEDEDEDMIDEDF